MTRRAPPSPPPPADPTIFMRPLMRPALIRDLTVILAGCAPNKVTWVNHRFNDYAVGFVTSGRGTFQLDGGPVRNIEPGCLFPVFPGPVFHYGPLPHTAWCEYHFGVSGPGLQRLIDAGVFPADGSVHQLVNVAPLVEGIRELLRVVRRAGPGDADRAVLMAERLLVEMYYSRESLQQAQTPSTSMQAVLEHCRRHFQVDVDFKALAAAHAMSYSTLRQSLRKLTGQAPAHYLTTLRCDAARTLLSDTDLSVKEIGARVGLGDPYTFSRIFKRRVGLSPQAYRRQAAPWAR
ncbi:MAG: AraC family transcriptional regulator [Planctomycetota bacterium]|nr:AraC family transcriptional regulator [Planctomycetota bacterium]